MEMPDCTSLGLKAPCIRLKPYARRAISDQPSAISKNKKLTAKG